MSSLQPSRLLVIHAGTHKTATSYIQSRLNANIAALARAGVTLHYPASVALKFKSLAGALVSGSLEPWRDYLRALPSSAGTVLMSGEHFTQPLARPDRHGPLLEVLAEEGFRLRVVVFLRDQPDYINARFVHSTRRLYHHQSFEQYVEVQLGKGRRSIYDYAHLFTPLLDQADGSADLELEFLAYDPGLGDPFERLVASQGWRQPEEGWRPADPSRGNVQPGCRGVWLAQAISARLLELGLDPGTLPNSGSVVRRVAEQEGWTDDRYCGFDGASAARVADHFASANAAFASRVWGCRWDERMPVVAMQRRVFTPPDDPTERRRLEQLVSQAIARLRQQNRSLKQLLQPGKANTMALS